MIRITKLTDYGILVLSLMADVPEELRAQLEDAVRLCPRQALRSEG